MFLFLSTYRRRKLSIVIWSEAHHQMDSTWTGACVRSNIIFVDWQWPVHFIILITVAINGTLNDWKTILSKDIISNYFHRRSVFFSPFLWNYQISIWLTFFIDQFENNLQFETWRHKRNEKRFVLFFVAGIACANTSSLFLLKQNHDSRYWKTIRDIFEQ